MSKMKNGSVYVIGGTCGTGKSTIGLALQNALSIKYHNLKYIEGDDLHSVENIEKMTQGIPLRDSDRWEWLQLVAKTSAEETKKYHRPCIITCSSLKKKYRDFIRSTEPDIEFIFFMLYAPKEEIVNRVLQRKNHFMKVDMVDNQFNDLEMPTVEEKNSFAIPVNKHEITEIICSILELCEKLS